MTSTRESDVFVLHPAILITGRVMFTLIFLLSGITHFTDLAGYVALMPAATPFAAFWVMISGVVELVGAIMILANRYARLGAWLIVLFLVPVTITVHGVMMMTAMDPMMQRIQLSFVLKGIAMAGGALIITQLGAGPVRRA